MDTYPDHAANPGSRNMLALFSVAFISPGHLQPIRSHVPRSTHHQPQPAIHLGVNTGSHTASKLNLLLTLICLQLSRQQSTMLQALSQGATALAPVLACSQRLLPHLGHAAAAQQLSLGGGGTSSSRSRSATRAQVASMLQQCRGMLWSVEREKGHTYKDTHQIVDEKAIHAAMESTQKAAKDRSAIAAILEAAKERSFLTNYTPGTWRVCVRLCCGSGGMWLLSCCCVWCLLSCSSADGGSSMVCVWVSHAAQGVRRSILTRLGCELTPPSAAPSQLHPGTTAAGLASPAYMLLAAHVGWPPL